MSYFEQIQANILLLILCLFIFSSNCFNIPEAHDPLFHQQNDKMPSDNGSKNSVNINIFIEKEKHPIKHFHTSTFYNICKF